MKRFLPLCIFMGFLSCTPAFAAGRPLSPQLQKLNISLGHWVFHGTSLNPRSGKKGTWTWDGNCRWSTNRIFLECTFDNIWAGQSVRSLVVDTWNTRDHSYWHYEVYAAGAPGDHPFVSRMTVHGHTWVESAQHEEHGKQVRERVVYNFLSPTRVRVAIQTSTDGGHWVTLDRGEGHKLP